MLRINRAQVIRHKHFTEGVRIRKIARQSLASQIVGYMSSLQ
jgi:hypothetical protein